MWKYLRFVNTHTSSSSNSSSEFDRQSNIKNHSDSGDCAFKSFISIQILYFLRMLLNLIAESFVDILLQNVQILFKRPFSLESCWLERIWLPVVLYRCICPTCSPRGQTCSSFWRNLFKVNNLSGWIDHIVPFN